MKTSVYRLYDADDGLLYVGLSSNVKGRVSSRRGNGSWGHQITRVEATEYANREDAAQAENVAILQDNPRFNNFRPTKETVTINPYKGRPTTERPRKRRVVMMMTEAEHAELDAAAMQESVSLSTFIRAKALTFARTAEKG